MQNIRATLSRLGLPLIGAFPEEVRGNVRIETLASSAFGLFYAAAISFLPVVLRRLGASSTLLATYTAQTYLGSVLATLGVLLMRGRPPKTFAATCWLASRSLILLTFLITGAPWLLALTALFWMLEALPAPAYARIVQAIYPVAYRGRALATVRAWMVLAMVIATPVAGYALDRLGYRVLFPLAGVLGVTSTLLFTRLRVDERALPPLRATSLRGIWSILGENRRFAIYLLGFSIYGLGFLMALPFFPIVQVDRLKLSYTTIGYLGLAQSISWMIGNMYWGRWVDRRGGLWVLRRNIAIAVLVPLTYVWAFDAVTLLPAFIAHGLISAGIDLGVISTGMELAGPDRVVEYSALQATIIGLRGMLAPFVGIALVGAGLPQRAIFVVACALIVGAWLVLGMVFAGSERRVTVPES